MSPDRARALIARYLGPDAQSAFDPDWPETMLGLRAEPMSRVQIERALFRALQTIASHPGAGEPEAQRLIRLLHSVAEQMIALYAPGSDRALAAPEVPPAPESGGDEDRAAEIAELRRQAARLYAVHGRLDSTVLARLGMIAVGMGLGYESVQRAVRELGSASGDPAPLAVLSDQSAPAVSPGPDEPLGGGAPGVPWGAITALVLGVLTLGGLSLVLGWVLTIGSGNVVAPPTRAAGVPAVDPVPAPAEPASTPQAPRPPVASDLLAQLRDAGEKLSDDPASGEPVLVASIALFRDHWALYEPSYRQAMIDECVTALGKSEDDPARAGVLLSLLLGDALSPAGALAPLTPEGVMSEVWHAGVALRLSRNAELPEAWRRRVGEALTARFGADVPGGAGSFNAGLVAACRLMPARFVRALQVPASDDAEPPRLASAWAAWERAVDSSQRVILDPDQGESQSQEMILAGLERVLRSGMDPASDPRGYALVSGCVSRLKFSPQLPARARVLAWMGDERIGAGSIHAVTATIAAGALAQGVDVSMVLAPGSSGGERQRLGEAYARAWALGQSGSGEALARLGEELARQLAIKPRTDDTALLHHAAGLARVSHAAALRVGGRNDAVVALLAKPQPPVPATGVPDSREEPPETGWAKRYLLTAGGDQARVTLLREIQLSGFARPGRLDAQVLIEAACTSTEPEVRAAAQQAALRFADEPEVLMALLNTLARMPRSEAGMNFAQRLSGAEAGTNEDWALRVRRALVQRVLTLRGAGAQDEGIDQLSGLLAGAYAGCAELLPEPPNVSSDEAPRRLSDSAERLARRLLEQARAHAPNPAAPVPIGAIESRASARLSLASTPVHELAARQVMIVECLAFIATGERPGEATRCRAILQELTRARRSASSVLEQIDAGEMALAQLWCVRAGVGVTP